MSEPLITRLLLTKSKTVTMNADSLKTELQQVLDSDLAIRKEYIELRRSLSDYRNQLINRDEDCKRLQVTIDVLNTKLSVLERDNGSFKSEINTLRESQAALQEEIQARQDELDNKLAEIHDLHETIARLENAHREMLESVRAEYELQARGISGDFEQRLEQERSEIVRREELLRAEYQNKIQNLNESWQQKLNELVADREVELNRLSLAHADEIFALREQYNTTLSGLSATNHEQQADLKVRYETRILELEQQLQQARGELQERFSASEVAIGDQLHVQREQLQAQFEANLESMAVEYAQREERLRAGYEARLGEMREEVRQIAEERTLALESRLAAARAHHEELLSESCLAYESRIAELINSYEEKIANMLIHSNACSSKLNAELETSRSEAEAMTAELGKMQLELQESNLRNERFAAQLEELSVQLASAREDAQINAQWDISAEVSRRDEQIAELTEGMAAQNRAHSEYVNELEETISTLQGEVEHMAMVFAGITNTLGDTESELESAQKALAEAHSKIAELEARLGTAEATAESKIEFDKKLAAKELEFQKLLVENKSLIAEIEESQRVVEIQQSELTLLRSELAEQSIQEANRISELRETLEMKNGLISRLEQNVSRLEKELDFLKDQMQCTVAETPVPDTSAQEMIAALQSQLKETEAELEKVRSANISSDQEAYIDRLFKQIDHLSHQRLQLLDEKEQMAGQILKMNELLAGLSQEVESEDIDVAGLNNHRKNLILGANSEGGDSTPMRKQINELVREIDKCIALLSA